VQYQLRRLDSPFTGFPSVRAVPGYINAGPVTTGGVFSVTKTDAVAASGTFIAAITVLVDQTTLIPGPWILNDGAILVAPAAVNLNVRAAFGYECWPAIRNQAQG